MRGRALLVGVMISAGTLFLLSLMVGGWVAYDHWLALPRFVLLSGGFLLAGAYGVGSKTEWKAVRLTTGCTWLAGGIGCFFLLTHDWRPSRTTDFQFLATVTAWLQQMQPAWGQAAWLALLRLHENAVAGALIILLPIGAVQLYGQWQQRLKACGLTVIALLPAIVALLFTFSRGAWLGLVVATVMTALAAMSGKWTGALWPWLYGTLLLGLAVTVFLITPASLGRVAEWLVWCGIGGAAASRLDLWQNAVTLVPDYWFTGSGLQSTAMVLSSYVYLLHVPYLAHGHNLYLQLTLEQGAPGLLAFTIGITGLLWASRQAIRQQPLVLGATVGLLALLGHGWFDAELYSSYLAPLLFLPVALLLSAIPMWPSSFTGTTAVGLLLPMFIILLLASMAGLRGLASANRAAVAQTRTELALYHWPAWPLQDAVRQQLPAEFVTITELYRAALQEAPDNVTAHRRLGQILLSQQDLNNAKAHLEAAYRLAPTQRATRQLLGEVYALTGKTAAAEQIWRGLDLTQGQLLLRVQWYAEAGKFKQSRQLTEVVQAMTKSME